ncbi:hypothetical protein CC80DRAFT_516316 [Byssothecium circinans]|uniref:Xylanolytic transcriptional activator regulatory domain-containing protein n=1 Tax=Byssothecium circinans TaxID=147558 RepID=A0A6A5TYP6_9PLEO|nr:hypothetical protein CC80DRAFT_516316 [Byssothecium circinans]
MDTHEHHDDTPNKRRKRGRQAAACIACHRRKQKVSTTIACYKNRQRLARTEATAAPENTAPRENVEISSSRATPDPRESRDPQVGNLFRSRDAPSFFGSSYFGPQAAAQVISEPAPDLSSGIRHAAGSAHAFRDVGGPFSQIWDLLGLLPRTKSSADRLTECFLKELNWTIDAIHPASFKAKYDLFWERKFGFDDFASIDLRWLALLFIVLAYGVLLDNPMPKNTEVQRELQETSLRFYWAARRAIVIAPTFYGESTDLAQGMHIDGERWRLPQKETETRRRLWSHLYVLDRTIALAIGRPYAVVDQQCLVKRATNVWLDDEPVEASSAAVPRPLSDPTPAVCNFLAHDLAKIVGKIQEKCFGLHTASYDTVLILDQEVQNWAATLPTYFRLEDPDISLDSSRPFLYWNRLHLHSIPYLLRQSITNRFKHSHDACIASACADLEMRMKSFQQPLTDRLKWTLGPHHLFNSALVLGIIAVRDPHSPRSHAILEDLIAYCEMQRADTWLNEFGLAEIKIVELCVKKAMQIRRNEAAAAYPIPTNNSPTPNIAPAQNMGGDYVTNRLDHTFPSPETTISQDGFLGMPNLAAGGGPFQWQAPWGDPTFTLLEPTDLQ